LFKNCSKGDRKLKEKETTHWNIPVPKLLDEALEAAIKWNWHRTKAEFIRDAVRHVLIEMGFKVRSGSEASQNQLKRTTWGK
jgi:hypothetical protein